MKIDLGRGGASVPPPRDIAAARANREPGPADHDAMRVESAVLAHVVVGHSEGARVDELNADLLITLPGAYVREVVENAIARLMNERLLRIEEGKVLPGPVFGTAMSTSHTAKKN